MRLAFGAFWRMIVSVSRRTDVPAFYAEWFFARLKAGRVLVRNPMNARFYSDVPLTPDSVDAFVFWSKNPAPLFEQIDRLCDYSFYFQFTLNPYDSSIEPNLPDKSRFLAPLFLKMADKLGPERVLWRYDPIIFTTEFTLDWHLFHFESLARRLKGATRRCTISFLDSYRKIQKVLTLLGVISPDRYDLATFLKRLQEIALDNGMRLVTCAEGAWLRQYYELPAGACVDSEILSSIAGKTLTVTKDHNQRCDCGCSESVDIGAYDSCLHGCLYCYANSSRKRIERNLAQFRSDGVALCSEPRPGDCIREYRRKTQGNGAV